MGGAAGHASVDAALAHRKGADLWAHRSPDGYAYLNGISCPTLVVNGSNDIVISTVNSFILQQNVPNAKLVLYPDSGHGSQYQFHNDFVAQVELFLDEANLDAAARRCVTWRDAVSSRAVERGG